MKHIGHWMTVRPYSLLESHQETRGAGGLLPHKEEETMEKSDVSRGKFSKEEAAAARKAAKAAAILAEKKCDVSTDPGIVLVNSPTKGTVARLKQLEDEAYASGSKGRGFAIHAFEGQVFAPFDGVVTAINEKYKNEITIKCDNGPEVFIRVGLDSEKMEGQHMRYRGVKVGSRVLGGQHIMSMSLLDMVWLGVDKTVVVIIKNMEDYAGMKVSATGLVDAGYEVVKLKLKN